MLESKLGVFKKISRKRPGRDIWGKKKKWKTESIKHGKAWKTRKQNPESSTNKVFNQPGIELGYK